jgi:hypothetical protein
MEKNMPKKIKTPKTPKVAAPVVAPAPVVKTDAEKIWDEIKSLPIDMFALPNQVVSDHVHPIPQIDPAKLYTTVRSTATLPSLEATVGKRFVVELADKFVIISRAPAPLPVPKKF